MITALFLTTLLINLALTMMGYRYHRRQLARLTRANRALEVCFSNQQTYIDELQRRVMRATRSAKACRVLTTHRQPNYQEIDLLQSDASGTALVCRVWLN